MGKMEFRDVNEDAIKCVLNGEDLEEWNITLEDLFSNDEKARILIDEIVQRAEEEYDFVMESDLPLAVQISSTGDEELVFTISKIGNVSPDKVESAMIGKILRDAVAKQLSHGKETEKKKKKDVKKVKGRKEKGGKDKKVLILYFGEFSHAVDFCRRLPALKGMDSSLYKDKKGDFIFVVKNSKSSNAEMERINWISGEFAKKIDKRSLTSEYILEHYKMLIKKDAISVLARL